LQAEQVVVLVLVMAQAVVVEPEVIELVLCNALLQQT
jgi:hypothetical protein